MSFIVVGRSTTDDSWGLLGAQAYDTQQAAARGIQSLAGTGAIDVEGFDVFIMDTSTAVPVVVVGLPAGRSEQASPARSSVSQGATLAEEPTFLESVGEAEPVGQEWTPTAARDILGEQSELADAAEALDQEATPDLASILKRAAEALEEQGIAAPESVTASATPEVNGDDIGVVIEALNTSGVQEPTDDVAAADGDASTRDDGLAWPWVNVEAVSTEAEERDETVAMDEPIQTDDGYVSILAEDSLILTSPAVGDEPFEPRPVIMGDYEELAASATASSENPPVAEEPAEDAFSGTVSAVDLPSADALTGVYEPSGELELSRYTCNDCVYANTCPKVGQSSPEECGAFQWKAT
ncbi:MAG: hypothetical protein LLG24_03380 [Actinomycetia bacterium]|nr:hypothetical protein [Actinomycetes bacterium]